VNGRLGPRTAGKEDVYEQLLDDIAAGVRLHYHEPGDDPDLALLDGDRLYARGLQTLAELGDLEATCELADVISLVAQAQATGDRALATAVWAAGTAAVGWGTDARYQAAKELARSGAPGAAQALLEAGKRLQRQ
jgi:hypothetical protein